MTITTRPVPHINHINPRRLRQLKRAKKAYERANRAYEKKREQVHAEDARWRKAHYKNKDNMSLYDYHMQISARNKDKVWDVVDCLRNDAEFFAEEYAKLQLVEILELPYEEWVERTKQAYRDVHKRDNRPLVDHASAYIPMLKKHEQHLQRYKEELRVAFAARQETRLAEEAPRDPDYSNIIPAPTYQGPPGINLPVDVIEALHPPDWLFDEGLFF